MNPSIAIDLLPIPALFFLTALLALASAEVGRWLGQRRKLAGAETEAPVGAAVGGVLALLAFTLAFTFSMAASRFDTRKQLVVDEANAIGTTYLRTSLLPQPAASKLRQLLREYQGVRLDAGLHPEHFAAALTRSGELHSAMWNEASAVAVQQPNLITTGLFIQALNQMIDLHGTRIAALRNRIPETIWVFLFVTASVGMMSIGYHAGINGSRRSVAALALVVAFSGVIMLIADLDRTQKGFLRISQQAMIELQQSMQAGPTGATASPAPPP